MIVVLCIVIAVVLIACALGLKNITQVKVFAAVVVLCACSYGVYNHYGYAHAVTLKKMLVQMDNDPASVDLKEVHVLLNKHLEKHTNDALAHAFQGRLFFSTQDYFQATQSFAYAYEFMQDDPDLLLEYATAIYFVQDQQALLDVLVKKLAALDPMPYSAHSLLANIAMDNQDNAQAVYHWKALLDNVPKHTDEYQAIQMMIKTLSTYDPELQVEKAPGQS